MENDEIENQGNYSTRSQYGVVKYFKTFEEALSDFLDYEGYRLDIKIDGAYIFFHRDELPLNVKAEPGSLAYEDPTRNIKYEAKLTVMKTGE